MRKLLQFFRSIMYFSILQFFFLFFGLAGFALSHEDAQRVFHEKLLQEQKTFSLLKSSTKTAVVEGVELRILPRDPEYKNEFYTTEDHGGVKKFSRDELEERMVFLHKGFLINKKGLVTFGGEFRTSLFVIGLDGQMYLTSAPTQRGYGNVRHSSFVEGAGVLAAGEMSVYEGKITGLSKQSGHYRPTDEDFESFKQLIRSQGALPLKVNFVDDHETLKILDIASQSDKKDIAILANNILRDLQYLNNPQRININIINLVAMLKPDNVDIHAKLANALSDDNAEVRSSALHALKKIQSKSSLVYERLVDASMEHEGYENPYIFIETLVHNPKISYEEKFQGLLRQFNNRFQRIKVNAVEALKEMRTKGHLPIEYQLKIDRLLAYALNDSDRKIGDVIAQALLQIQPTDHVTIKTLLQHVSDNNSVVRDRAASVLCSVLPNDSIFVGDLVDLLSNLNEAVSFKAAEILGHIKPKNKANLLAIAQLLMIQDQNKGYVKYAAEIALKNMKDPITIPYLKELLKNSQVNAFSVLDILCEIDPMMLLTFIEDSDQQIREAALSLYGFKDIESDALNERLLRQLASAGEKEKISIAKSLLSQLLKSKNPERLIEAFQAEIRKNNQAVFNAISNSLEFLRSPWKIFNRMGLSKSEIEILIRGNLRIRTRMGQLFMSDRSIDGNSNLLADEINELRELLLEVKN